MKKAWYFVCLTLAVSTMVVGCIWVYGFIGAPTENQLEEAGLVVDVFKDCCVKKGVAASAEAVRVHEEISMGRLTIEVGLSDAVVSSVIKDCEIKSSMIPHLSKITVVSGDFADTSVQVAQGVTANSFTFKRRSAFPLKVSGR